jgi:flagellar basal body-associated protein FliL
MEEKNKNQESQETQATEAKEEKKTSEIVKSILKYILGIVLVVGGAILWWIFRKEFLTVLVGCLGPFLILAGVITIAIAKE